MPNPLRYFNSSAEVIRRAVMMYIRNPLSLRQVDDLLFERGIDIRHETFMVEHPYRSRANRRHEQSELLNEWAQDQALPVIAVGDYNYNWDVPDGDTDHDASFDFLTADDVFTWVRPPTLIATASR